MKRFIALLALMLVFGSVTLAQDTKPAEKEDTKAEATDKKSEKIDLTAVHKKGVKSSYQIIEANTQKQSFMDQENESTSTETFDVAYECTDIDDKGSASIKFNYERIRIVTSESEDGDGDKDYDSKRDKFDGLDDDIKIQALMIGTDFVFVAKKDGDINQVSGYADYEKKVSDNVSKDAANQISLIGSDGIIKERFMAASRHLPTEAVAVGDTWVTKWDVSLGMIGSMSFEATYKFEGLEDKNGHKCAKISTEIEMSIETEMEIDIDDSESTGTTWVDLETRETVYSEMKTKMVMVINMGMVINSTSTGTYTVALKDENFKEKEPAKKEKKEDDF